MKAELITEENIWKCLPIMTNDDYRGWDDGLLSCFGVFDEESGNAVSLASVMIFPEQIRIERLFTLPEYRRKGAATELLRVIMDVPDEIKLPFTALIFDKDANTGFLTSRGFKEERSDYSCIISTLSEMKDLKVSEKLKAGITLLPLEKVNANELEHFIFSSEPDTFLQFPEYEFSMDRFSEGSIVCRHNGRITSAILLEELEGLMQVTWLHGSDTRSLYCSFSMLKKILEKDLSPETKIRVLICADKGKDAVLDLFKSSEEIPIRVFKK